VREPRVPNIQFVFVAKIENAQVGQCREMVVMDIEMIFVF